MSLLISHKSTGPRRAYFQKGTFIAVWGVRWAVVSTVMWQGNTFVYTEVIVKIPVNPGLLPLSGGQGT